jgi:hypothetical protein
MSGLRERVEKFAREHDLVIDEDNFMNVVGNNDFCPCRVDKVEENRCPCIYALDEIEADGHCMCMLFWKRT